MPYNAGSAIQRVTLVNAATDADYTVTAGTAADPNVVVGNVAAGATDSGAPVKQGGVYNLSLPTYTTGQRGDVQLNSNGAALVAFGPAGALDGLSAGAIQARSSGAASSGALAVYGYVFNGGTADRLKKPNITKRIASSAASGNPDFLKASAGDLVMFWGQNGAAITYIQVYNKASAPTIGTDTPILTFPVAANERFNVQIPGGGYYFATGIAYAFTTDAAGTTGAAAAAVTACNIIGA